MRWFPKTDYHNGRQYDDDRPTRSAPSRARITIAWLARAGQRQLKALLKAAEPPDAPPIEFSRGLMRGYTMLGLTDREAQDARSTAIPWPVARRGTRSARPALARAARADMRRDRRGADEPPPHVEGR